MAQMCSLFACQDRKYVLFYLIGGKWFPDIAARSRRKRLHNVPLTTFRCDHYDRNSLRVVYSRKLLHEFQTVHDRHIDVAKNQIHLIVLDSSESFSSVPSFENLGKAEPCLA